jgi:hypothetical protein
VPDGKRTDRFSAQTLHKERLDFVRSKLRGDMSDLHDRTEEFLQQRTELTHSAADRFCAYSGAGNC